MRKIMFNLVLQSNNSNKIKKHLFIYHEASYKVFVFYYYRIESI